MLVHQAPIQGGGKDEEREVIALRCGDFVEFQSMSLPIELVLNHNRFDGTWFVSDENNT